MDETSVFEYKNNNLIARVTLADFPQAVTVVKDYLTSRLIPEAERAENPIEYIDRLLKSLPPREAAKINIEREILLRGSSIKNTTKASPLIADIPVEPKYCGKIIDITKGNRSSNIVVMENLKYGTIKGKGTIQVFFENSTGDDTRPLYLMQYDGLFKNAAEAGFSTQRDTLDEQIATFKHDDTYFQSNVKEAMSSFEYPELKLVLQFLWGNNLPEDIQRQLVQ